MRSALCGGGKEDAVDAVFSLADAFDGGAFVGKNALDALGAGEPRGKSGPQRVVLGKEGLFV
jgi:hypothetical protein